ncbi:phage upper tail fiber protein [Nocardia sp. NPDC004750]
MTVISEDVADIAGADDTTQFEFSSPFVRESGAGGGLITTRARFFTAVNGVLTTPSLDPGPTIVRIGQATYHIEVPDSATPILLTPLLEAATPVPPADEAAAVRNGGGVARIQRITESAYLALTTPDPETLYVVLED